MVGPQALQGYGDYCCQRNPGTVDDVFEISLNPQP